MVLNSLSPLSPLFEERWTIGWEPFQKKCFVKKVLKKREFFENLGMGQPCPSKSL
jgi:hypothetical protein